MRAEYSSGLCSCNFEVSKVFSCRMASCFGEQSFYKFNSCLAVVYLPDGFFVKLRLCVEGLFPRPR